MVPYGEIYSTSVSYTHLDVYKRQSLDGSGMNYIAGDALAVIPSNDPALADALIDKLGLSPD